MCVFRAGVGCIRVCLEWVCVWFRVDCWVGLVIWGQNCLAQGSNF